MVTENEYLKACERGHTKRVGEGQFCYVAVKLFPNGECWGIAITAADIAGYIPISDDIFLGNEREMQEKAEELNEKRLNLSRHAAARIIGRSMSLDPDPRGRRRVFSRSGHR